MAAALPHTDAEVLVIADADSWAEGTGEAVRLVAGGHTRWAVPHWHVRRLAAPATARVLAGGRLGGELERPAYVGYAGGGITVIRRDAYERTPLDRRFLGWGGEDMSWGLALSTLEGEGWRGQADLWHLWHGAAPRVGIYGSDAARGLHHQYRRARGKPDRMRRLVQEGHHRNVSV
ncbi:hypothetical protein [Streptomyces sp. NPDC057554]|uniref:hypothetical protein n=1 Tax=Streptomyces sp. NPDC057554 TaxID=3350538 RepID=UPI0036BC2C3D